MSDLTKHDRRAIRWWLSNRYTDFENPTAAAEVIANELGHPEWLDDETSELWDIALEFYEEGDE